MVGLIIRVEDRSRMNDRTVILHVRRSFEPDFGKIVGELAEEAVQLRAEKPDLAASAVFVSWRGSKSGSAVRLYHHPPGVEAPIALVAGRHSECDLGSIPGASLRHALILLWPPRGQTHPFAEILDLGTQTGIALPDGRLAMRIATSRPVRLGVASADVMIIHAAAGEPLALDPDKLSEQLRAIPEDSEVTPHANQPRHLDIPASGEARMSDLPVEPEGVEEAKSLLEVPVKPGPERTFGSEHMMLTQIVRLGDRHAGAKVNVRAEDLARGVRLGRYLRCRGASVLGRDDHVSRVHALVLDRAGHRWLFDTASTNGTAVVDVATGLTSGPVRGERTFALHEGQAPSLAGQVAVLEVGTPSAPH